MERDQASKFMFDLLRLNVISASAARSAAKIPENFPG